MTSQSILINSSIVHIDEFNIIHVKVHKHVHLEVKDMIEVLDVLRKLSNNNKSLVMFDNSEMGGLSIEAKKFAKSEEFASAILASAMIVGNPISKITGNFFSQITPTPYPQKIFLKKENAVRWLLSLNAGNSHPINKKIS